MFDYEVPEFFECMHYCFIGGLISVLLSVILYLMVVYIPV